MTTPLEITLQTAHLRALTHLAAKTDIRTQINGVQIEARRNTVLVGSDGTVLGAIDTGVDSVYDFDLLVPHTVLAVISKSKSLDVRFHSADGKTWAAHCGDGTIAWLDKPSTYPDWRRVVPATTSGVAQQFNAELIERFAKASAALGGKKVGCNVFIAHNGGGLSALVTLVYCHQFIGAISALNPGGLAVSQMATTAPYWVRGARPGAAAKAAPECDLA